MILKFEVRDEKSSLTIIKKIMVKDCFQILGKKRHSADFVLSILSCFVTSLIILYEFFSVMVLNLLSSISSSPPLYLKFLFLLQNFWNQRWTACSLIDS